MGTIALSGSDTVKINNKILADFADGDIATLGFPNELATMKVGKNGNTIYSLNETGRQADLVLRVLKGSADDKFLNTLMVSQKSNFASFILLNGEFTKRMGDGTGKVTNDVYILGNGIFTKEVEAKSNTEGDAAQSVSVYNIKFASAPRSIE